MGFLEGGAFMKTPLILSAILVTLIFGGLTPQFTQDTPDPDRRAQAIGLVRTIGTAEFAYKSNYGSFGTWQTLLSNPEQQKYLDNWLRRTNLDFDKSPEILPGWNLRLNVHSDGQQFDLLLEDMTDKSGYAALLTEHGGIRECRWLQ